MNLSAFAGGQFAASNSVLPTRLSTRSSYATVPTAAATAGRAAFLRLTAAAAPAAPRSSLNPACDPEDALLTKKLLPPGCGNRAQTSPPALNL